MDTATTSDRQDGIAAPPQRELFEALLAHDSSALSRLVAADCQIIGPKGFLISKQGWIDAHTDEVYELVDLEVVDTAVQLWKDAAVTVEQQRSSCVFNGEHIDGLFRVTSVWHAGLEGWQLVALQYTAMSPAAQSRQSGK